MTCETNEECAPHHQDLIKDAKNVVVGKLRLARQQHGNAKGLSNENELIQIYKRCIFHAYNAAPHLFPDVERPIDPDQREEVVTETSTEEHHEREPASHESSGRTSDRTIDEPPLETEPSRNGGEAIRVDGQNE